MAVVVPEQREPFVGLVTCWQPVLVGMRVSMCVCARSSPSFSLSLSLSLFLCVCVCVCVWVWMRIEAGFGRWACSPVSHSSLSLSCFIGLRKRKYEIRSASAYFSTLWQPDEEGRRSREGRGGGGGGRGEEEGTVGSNSGSSSKPVQKAASFVDSGCCCRLLLRLRGQEVTDARRHVTSSSPLDATTC